MLCGKSKEGGHPKGHPCRHSLWLDPEGDPGHHHDQAGGDVGVEHEVTEKNKCIPDINSIHSAGIHKRLHFKKHFAVYYVSANIAISVINSPVAVNYKVSISYSLNVYLDMPH